MPTAIDRAHLAGAPISWGVCEVPGWGPALPPERALSEMRRLGFTATELGPAGYLGADAASIRRALDRWGLGALGGFQPLVLHDPAQRAETRRRTETAARLLQAVGARHFVTAAVADLGWSKPSPLGGAQWQALFDGVAMVDEICDRHDLIQVLHPHVGTLIESPDQVDRVLGASEVRWCLDTGHLALGGIDPLTFAVEHADRVGLVHLKDVRLEFGPALRARTRSLLEATRQGVFRPLGEGDVDVRAVAEELIRRGYDGWYVFEQDTVISGDPASADPASDVRRSVEHLIGSTARA
ncbi:MAG: sugar phosphate isomerase/epimerase family protein [Candidatus Dormibacteraceae bacterium]